MLSSNTHLAFLFPGQGSQSVGMLAKLATDFPLILETYAEASAILGYDLWQLVQEGPESILNQTEHTQPALLAGSVAMFRVWKSSQKELPAWMAGHSLGEYSALVCADALNYKDAVSLVALRGRLMQQAVREGEGAMAAIVGLSDEQVMQICTEAAQNNILAPANFNAIGQIVLAGETAAIERALVLAKDRGAKIAKLIPVSVPSHCLLMKPAADQLVAQLSNISIEKPQIPVISNVDVANLETPEQIRSALIRQLYNPVRWVETIQLLSKKGIENFIECGPGKVLTGLNKRIVPQLSTVVISFSNA